jgi:hypothetical protein
MPSWGLLGTIQGKVILRSFCHASMADFTRKQGWHTIEIRLSSAMARVGPAGIRWIS